MSRPPDGTRAARARLNLSQLLPPRFDLRYEELSVRSQVPKFEASPDLAVIGAGDAAKVIGRRAWKNFLAKWQTQDQAGGFVLFRGDDKDRAHFPQPAKLFAAFAHPERVAVAFGETEVRIALARIAEIAKRAATLRRPALQLPSADLRGGSGRLDANCVADVFGLTKARLSAMLGRSKQAISKTPDAESLQPALRDFERIAALRDEIGSDADLRKWLQTPHRLLGGNSPLERMDAGQLKEIADFVDDMLSGSPT
jgi:hypothetical protein